MNALFAVIILALVRIVIPMGVLLMLDEWVQKHQKQYQFRW